MVKKDPSSNNAKAGKRSYSIIIEKDKCKSCGLCILYCPGKLLTLSKGLNNKGLLYAEKNKGACLGCNACVLICPDSCIHVREEKCDE